MTKPFRTPPASAAVHPLGWERLPSGVEVTLRPLLDVDAGLWARLTYRDALDAAKRLGGRLPTRAEVIEAIAYARAHGIVLPPVALSFGPEMVTREHAEAHDGAVVGKLGPRRLESVLVAGIGKHWVAGASPGRSRICGWPRADGSLVQGGTTDVHDDLHHDYATTTILVRDAVADTDPAPPPSSATGAQDASGLSDDPTPVPDGEDAPAWRLGLRALAWLGVQAVQGVREVPGLASDPRILAYSRECRRGGTFLGVRSSASEHVAIWTPDARPLPLSRDEDPWCAALASAALFMALVTGEAPPHGLRVSVRELCEDGRGTGAMKLVGSGYEPRPGDLAILPRAGGNPLLGGQGHVHRVLQLDGARYLAIGGNEGDAIRVDWHPRARVLAWIAYP